MIPTGFTHEGVAKFQGIDWKIDKAIFSYENPKSGAYLHYLFICNTIDLS